MNKDNPLEELPRSELNVEDGSHIHANSLLHREGFYSQAIPVTDLYSYRTTISTEVHAAVMNAFDNAPEGSKISVIVCCYPH